jgi:hypothetical protein
MCTLTIIRHPMKFVVVDRRCDQIGRIFAKWTIIHCWAFFKIHSTYVNTFLGYLFHRTRTIERRNLKKMYWTHFGRLFHKNIRSHCWPTFRRKCPSVGRQVVLTTKSSPWLAHILLHFHSSDRSLPKNTWCDVLCRSPKCWMTNCRNST